MEHELNGLSGRENTQNMRDYDSFLCLFAANAFVVTSLNFAPKKSVEHPGCFDVYERVWEFLIGGEFSAKRAAWLTAGAAGANRVAPEHSRSYQVIPSHSKSQPGCLPVKGIIRNHFQPDPGAFGCMIIGELLNHSAFRLSAIGPVVPRAHPGIHIHSVLDARRRLP